MSSELVGPESQASNQWSVYGLAGQLAAAQNQALGPKYDVLRDQLNTVLSNQVMSSMAENQAIRLANSKFLSRVHTILPHLESDTYEAFYPKDVFDLRRLQSQLLWRRGPSYIIGINSRPGSRTSQILTMGAGIYSPDLSLYTISTKSLRSLQDVSEELLTSPATEEFIRENYSGTRQSFVLRSRTEGSLRARSEELGRRIFKELKYTGRKDSPSCIRDRGLKLQLDYSGRVSRPGPSAEDMRDFNVFGHLGRLATLFEVSDKYQTILEEEGKTQDAFTAIEQSVPAIEPSDEDLR